MAKTSKNPVAPICAVEPFSPADDAGFTSGCALTHVDGHPLRDILDWRWYADGDEIEVSYIDADGDSGTVALERDLDEDWGFTFEGVIFDSPKLCRNACTFCFMRQMPDGMRPSLTMRDDDYRLSFLQGTFITLTNLGDDDLGRIIEQHISPLRVSLHAYDGDVRRALIGRHAQTGIENLVRLLDAGIEFDAQIVLVPGVNDGDILKETLEWAYAHPGIKNLGIVPLGYTRFQGDFDRSFDEPAQALEVIELIQGFQARAMEERGHAWVYGADEFYRNAYGEQLLEKLPSAEFYGDFEMYEDGIGIIRSAVDDFERATAQDIAKQARDVLAGNDMEVLYICGEAMLPYTRNIIKRSVLADVLDVLPVKNEFFGGNVNVTGLLTGADIAWAISIDAVQDIEQSNIQDIGEDADANTGRANRGTAQGAKQESDQRTAQNVRNDADQRTAQNAREGKSRNTSQSIKQNADTPHRHYFIPKVIFNSDMRTLDDMTFDEVCALAAPANPASIHLVSTNPLDYIEQMNRLAD